MIKNTFEKNPEYVLSAYKDNAAVMEGSQVGRFFADHEAGRYDYHQEDAHILMKVETHNHPTAISPSVMKVQRVVALSQKPVWSVSLFPTCAFLVLNSHGKKISASRIASSPRWIS
ncbi:Phosphoribosylformylglycinamidine synthase [compost metagenome]